ncbi:hypothetical protein NPIL_454231 [Nephila pilipes]|uniref:Uncharacterized protein n=1 Tax=Nephila pilipes TaxID=299642 RepID=A0A8X6NUZ5_NEPPI|nr:hypothetical protein NPIL_454231 [Nephila pilipes]
MASHGILMTFVPPCTSISCQEPGSFVPGYNEHDWDQITIDRCATNLRFKKVLTQRMSDIVCKDNQEVTCILHMYYYNTFIQASFGELFSLTARY